MAGKKCRLACMFCLTFFFFLVELIVGYATNSMALVADSFHMLSDIAALVIAFVSVRMAPKSWERNTYGWARAEVLGALVNAVFLVALCFSITVESLKRFYEPEEIHSPVLILVVGGIGLLVNLLGLCMFHEHGHSHGISGRRDTGTHSHLHDLAPENSEEKKGVVKTEDKIDQGQSGSNMNMRGVFLHLMADALGSVIVIISALIMWKTDWEFKLYVDPGLSLILVTIMMYSVTPLLIESALILLQTVPTHIEVEVLKRKLVDVPGVLAVHDFHVWQLTGDRIIASAHIKCHNLSEYMKVAEDIKQFFHNEGIHSTTIQPEFVDYPMLPFYSSNEDCALSCPRDSDESDPACRASKCCPRPRSSHNTPEVDRKANAFTENEMHTSTPNGQIAPNLATMMTELDENSRLTMEESSEFSADLDLSNNTSNFLQNRSDKFRRINQNQSIKSNQNSTPSGFQRNSGRRGSGNNANKYTISYPRKGGQYGRNSNVSTICTNSIHSESSGTSDDQITGITPLKESFRNSYNYKNHDYHKNDNDKDDVAIFTPRATSRVVKIISKQSNV